MEALHLVGPQRVVPVTVPEPEVRDNALVEIYQAGVCGTDLQIYCGAIPVSFPRIMGHEAIGRVRQSEPLGLFKVGQRVMINPVLFCGLCEMCWRDRGNLCLHGGFLGRDLDGVFAQYIQLAERQLHPIPDSINDDAAGLLQVLGTCIHAQKAVEVFPGQVAAVVGLGVSGLLMVQLLRLRGARVVGITRSAWKRELAEQFGAAATASPDEARAALRKVSGHDSADLVVEAVGTEETLAYSIQLAGPAGVILAFGTIAAATAGLPYFQLYQKELTLVSPRAALARDYEAAIQLTSEGVLDLEQIVTHRLTLQEAASAFRIISEGRSLKVLLSVP